MQRLAQHSAVVILATFLCGCAVDSNLSFAPDFMKQAPPASSAPDVPPDVGSLLKSNVNAVFAQGSSPADLRFSPPVAGKYGGWDTCVQGEVVGVTGQPLGLQTYLVNIDRNHVGRRERVGSDHWCARETYKRL
ncbi:hypothetical protein LPW26_10220 [Rhodopseudomonas sp. HC1]|uniref:hypothetical protein n=1 Tax=Rhodopseudomonas infernalis TaxID=2897386 RepID=UPI001EE99621|nr:hypothetical protein [Rhodopseudomonas infernalis]MCG6205012.1 hypothetical protein [Rhodopseudomonas infernalis]